MGSGSIASVASPRRIMIQGDRGARPFHYGPSKTADPLVTSAATSWAGAPFEVHEVCSNEAPKRLRPVDGEHHLRVVLDGSYDLVIRNPSGDLHRRGVPGTVTFHSGEGPQASAVFGSARTMIINVSDAWLRRVVQDAVPSPGTHALIEADETAHGLAQAMCREVEEGAESGSLFAESLSLALLSYALERMPVQMRVHGGLSESQCRRLRRYIRERLASDIRLADLAALCDLQSRHFTTLFRRAFDTTPHRYVMQQRLERGAELLSHSGHDIAEIALQSGFSSQSHFTTAFRKHYGTTPRRYAESQRVNVAVPRNASLQ
ncbi:MAG: helix-turn-helix transcriptional regulator [Myxococcales bacterium]|nr:helix-turn-helix transcriptional regulator [Myxococcales bacterium]